MHCVVPSVCICVLPPHMQPYGKKAYGFTGVPGMGRITRLPQHNVLVGVQVQSAISNPVPWRATLLR